MDNLKRHFNLGQTEPEDVRLASSCKSEPDLTNDFHPESIAALLDRIRKLEQELKVERTVSKRILEMALNNCKKEE